MPPWALCAMPVFDTDNEVEAKRAADEREEEESKKEEDEEDAPKADKETSTSRLDLWLLPRWSLGVHT